MLRGREKQINLNWGNIYFLIVTSDRFAGCRKLEIISLIDKTVPIFVNVLYYRDNTDMVKCINNKSAYIVYWVQYK